MGVTTVEADEVSLADILGSPVERREDLPLITGDAEYVDDIQHPRTQHMAVVRSQYAHARIEAVETDAAEAMDGVAAVYTAADVEASDAPARLAVWVQEDYATFPERPLLAIDRVRYQGEPIAVVVAEDRYVAAEAAEAVDVTYDRLDAVTDPDEALEGEAPTVHEESPDNVALTWDQGDADATADALDAADTVVELELVNNRLIPTAMEPRAAIARYRGSTDELTVEMTSQNPHLHQRWLAETLGHPDHKIRVRAPHVGGGFGSKIHHYPDEALAAWCAMRTERPVKWVASRSEGFLSTSHGRNHRTTAAVGLDEDGTIRALRVDTRVGVGAFLSSAEASVAAPDYGELLCGQYEIPAFYAHVTGAWTNDTPVDAYRGAGRPEASYVIERVLDAAADELGVDPAALRRRNFLQPEDFPVEVLAGRTYDSGAYERTLDLALEHVDYEALRDRQERLREEGRYLGIGLSAYVEACGVGPGLFESGLVRFKPSGTVVVESGTHSHGQGHRTSYAQIVANTLGVPYDDIEVLEGDTAEVPEGNGTYGSRSGPVAGSAVLQSARKVRERARRIAAHQLEAAPEDLEFADGEFAVSGAPERSLSIQEVAQGTYAGDIPAGEEPGLEETSFYDPENFTFPFGTHVAVVEVDPESGEISFERYVAVDDVGEQINPKIVEGQIHGGIGQGLGQAMLENAVYDDNGQLLSGSLQDYALPKAHHMPEVETDETVTPCPHNPLGVKGVGEAGTIAAPPAIVNAVVDALSPFGVSHVDMPVTPETVWRAAREAE